MTDLPFTIAERNINSVISRATPEELIAGINWYPLANAIAREMADGDLIKGAGVLAALSPQKNWDVNVRIARESFELGRGTGNTPANNDKVTRILNGEEPLDVIGGKKVVSFFHNIVNPTGKNVTIDRHAVSVAIGRYSTDDDTKFLSRKGVYDSFATAYRRSAGRMKKNPAEVQAISWLVIRREKGIK